MKHLLLIILAMCGLLIFCVAGYWVIHGVPQRIALIPRDAEVDLYSLNLWRKVRNASENCDIDTTTRFSFATSSTEDGYIKYKDKKQGISFEVSEEVKEFEGMDKGSYAIGIYNTDAKDEFNGEIMLSILKMNNFCEKVSLDSPEILANMLEEATVDKQGFDSVKQRLSYYVDANSIKTPKPILEKHIVTNKSGLKFVSYALEVEVKQKTFLQIVAMTVKGRRLLGVSYIINATELQNNLDPEVSTLEFAKRTIPNLIYSIRIEN